MLTLTLILAFVAYMYTRVFQVGLHLWRAENVREMILKAEILKDCIVLPKRCLGVETCGENGGIDVGYSEKFRKIVKRLVLRACEGLTIAQSTLSWYTIGK